MSFLTQNMPLDQNIVIKTKKYQLGSKLNIFGSKMNDVLR